MPVEANNAITNGGASTIGNDGCETPDTEANSANDIATCSSRGPCSDQRKKPPKVTRIHWSDAVDVQAWRFTVRRMISRYGSVMTRRESVETWED